MGLYDSRTNRRSLSQTIDWWLIACYFIITVIGIMNIYASVHSVDGGNVFDPSLRSGKQIIWLGISIVAGALILFAIPPRLYEGLSLPIYILTVLLLIAVIFIGGDIKGSRSWLVLGPVRFQPAEISKIATSLMLAKLMSQTDYRITRPRDFVLTALVILVPMLTIVLQKETGSALVYCGFIFMLYREGLSGWYIVAAGLAILTFILTLTIGSYFAVLILITLAVIYLGFRSGMVKLLIFSGIPLGAFFYALPWLMDWLCSLAPDSFLTSIRPIYILLAVIVCTMPFIIRSAFRNRHFYAYYVAMGIIVGTIFSFSTDFIFNNILQDHQRGRIEVLLGLKEDPSGVGYNVNQSMIAIGSGGAFGKGYLQGTQTTFGFVPEQSTDFIFCTIGEEWGFFGSAAVILLYVFFIWRIIHDAEESRESFTRIYGYCFASCIFMHLFINIGMTIGLMPVIGIPLPYVSYGGSALLSFSLMLFIFVALRKNEKKYF
ncbi:MAG: rod shape-determining protein RodA [Candidatus Cryptobacteroides sp.]